MIKDWLDKMQQESWQLELIISGFSLVLLLQIGSSINQFIALFETHIDIDGIALGKNLIKAVWLCMVLNLVAHLFLRSLWVGAIGLRSVSKDIDHEQLNYQPIFKQFLQRKIPSFDAYIQDLEDYCSLVFAFTFLIAFACMGVSTYAFLLAMLSKWIDWPMSVSFLIYFMSSLYFIDFVSLGFFKKRKYLSRIYYPFYRFYGWLTLAFLIRPLYYNFIDHPKSRKVARIIIPYLLIIITSQGLYNNIGNLFLAINKNNKNFINRCLYIDTSTKNCPPIQIVSLPSKYVKNDFLELFLPYDLSDSQSLKKKSLILLQ